MSSVTREVILKVKMDMAKTAPTKLDYKQFALDAGKVTKELRSSTAILERHAALWERVASAAERTAKASARSGRGLGGGGSESSGGGSGGLGIGGHASTGIGRFLHHAVLGLTGGIAINEARTLLPALWGQHLHGGQLRRGSAPFLEGIVDAYTGRDQAEYMQERRLERFNAGTQYGMDWQNAQNAYRSTMQGIEMSSLPVNATPFDRLRLLKQQQKPWGSLAGFHAREMKNLEAGLPGRLAEIEGNRQRQLLGIRQEQREANNPDAAPGSDFSSLAKWALHRYDSYLNLGPRALLTAAGRGDIAGEGGIFHGRGLIGGTKAGLDATAINQESDRQLLETRITTTQAIVAALEKQKAAQNEILKNLQQQQVISKEIVMANKQSLSAFGHLDPFEQRTALDSMKRLREGKLISFQEEANLEKTTEGAEVLRRSRDSKALLSGRHLELQEASGLYSIPEIQRQREVLAGTQAMNVFAGAVGAQNLPPVEIHVNLNEQSLVAAIVDALSKTAEAIQFTDVALAVKRAERIGLAALKGAELRSASLPSMGNE